MKTKVLLSHFTRFTLLVFIAAGLLSSCTSIKKTRSSEVKKSAEIKPKIKKEPIAKASTKSPSKEETTSEPEKSKPVESNKLELFCAEWKGTPYKYGGSAKTGTDCSGFTCQLYREVYGVNLPRSSGDMAKSCIKVEEADLRIGDLVFFKINGRTISHVGVYLGDKNFIHASTRRGVIVSNLSQEYYRRTFAHGGRF